MSAIGIAQAPAQLATRPQKSHGARRVQTLVAGLIMLTTAVIVSAVVIAPYSPPRVAPASAPAGQFSAARAMPALEAIAQQPHPVGSAAGAATRGYLVQQLSVLGLQPEVQQTEALDTPGGQAVVVHNVMARLGGTTSSRAVLVTAHYDSLETTPGVGDNGMAVAAMLETIRALQAGPALRNDVIFLFNDGEEYGLSGSVAFVRHHAWARDVAIVFDFDGDGPTGLPTLEWMTPADSWIVGELAKSDSGLLATPEDGVAKRSANNNDLHVFAAAGYPGAHIGRVGGSTYYHNQRDSLENLDPGGLQQLGNVMLSLARHFGNIPLEGNANATEDSIVFTVFGTRMVSYPFNWSGPLAALATLLALAAIMFAWRRHRFSSRRLVAAIGSVLPLAIVGALIAQLAWQAVLATHPESKDFRDADFYAQTWYVGAVYAFTVAAGLAIWPWLTRRCGEEAVVSAGLVGMAAISALISQMQTSIAYLVMWPTLAGAFGLVCLLAVDRARHPWFSLGLLVLIAVPAVGFPVAGLYQSIVGGAEGSPALSVALLLLLLALLAPQLGLIAGLSRRLVPGAAAAVGALLLVGGVMNSAFDAANPRPENLVYIVDSERGQAYWASPRASVDEWTGQFLVQPAPRTLDELLGVGGSTTLLTSPAPALQLPGPELVLRGEERDGDVRTLRLHLSSQRHAWRGYVLPVPGVQLVGAALGDGSPATLQTASLDVPGLPAEGLDFTFRVRASSPVSFVVIDQTPGLPELAGAAPRAESVMAAPTPDNLRGFATVVRSVFAFP